MTIKKYHYTINLNSKDVKDQNNSTKSSLVFNFHSLLTNEDEVFDAKIGIIDAQIPVSFYNINAYNNTLNYTINGLSKTLNLDVGNYNETNFITNIKLKFISLGDSFSILFNKITGKLQFTNLDNYDFIFLNSSLFSVIGFKKDNDFSSSSFVLSGIYPFSIIGTKKLKIISEQINLRNYDSYKSSTINALGFIPVNACAFGMILYENRSGKYSSLQMMALDNFEISLLDDDNNPIDFNGIDWSMTLQLTIYKNEEDRKSTSFSDMFKNDKQQSNAIVENNFYDDDLQFLLYQNRILI